MSKKSISVTLEESTIECLKTTAESEMRSVSNLIDYIVMLYAKSNNSMNEIKRQAAAQAANDAVIRPYSETQVLLSTHVKMSEADKAVLLQMGAKV